jgi:type IV secretory pathway ATPase VirB11/archaellum biosynthesis ATPase/intein/homing endonuclease
MSFLKSIKQAFSDEEDGDGRNLAFEMDDENLDFTLSDKQDVKITSKIDKLADVDVKYPLIKPFAYAHVKWNEEQKEIIYRVIEPEMDEETEELLNMVKENLSEKIDISLSSMGGREKIIEYLEGQINDLMIELGISMTDEQHKKILYYIYRDFVGLGKVEPFMHDPYIEDLGCDGTGTPIFAVHSEFGSVKSNVVYNDQDDLENLVIKLAERAGRYVSYANPLLDGALPDGSRVNASLTEDVTAHGPTFSIRKFQETPFSAVDMMDLGTANAEIMAYMWILQQYQQSILICGGTSTGKTSFLNATVSFIPPEDKIVSIEDSVTGDTEIELFENGNKIKKPIADIIDPLIEEKGRKLADGAEKVEVEHDIKTATINENLKTDYQKPSSFYRHKVDKDIYQIKTASGRELEITEDHSIFTLQGSKLKEIKPQESEDERIAVPRKLPAGEGVNHLNVLQNAENKERLFAEGEAIKELYDQAGWTRISEISDISNSGFKHWKRNQMIRGKEIHRMLEEDFDINQNYRIRSKSKSIEFQPEIKITASLLQMFGLWLGDGSYDRHNDNCVLVTTSEKEVEETVRTAADELDINVSRKNDGTLSINSVVLLELMKGLGFKGKSKTKEISDFCINLDEEQIGSLLRGYFSADGCVKAHEVVCSSQSRELLEGVQDLLLRLGIVSSINDYSRKDECMELSISSQKFLEKFEEKVSFIQERKRDSLEKILERDSAHHEKKDVIPTTEELAEKVHSETNIQWNYRNNVNNLGRNYLSELTENKALQKLADSDIYWDKVVEVEKIDTEEAYVYDISVPESERFMANNILAHNTRELQLPHENWIPSVTREMFGTSSQGDVDMDQLLKESFRQNPDYVVVGEVRGAEASVLFQGMSSGHPSLGTMHASSPNAVVKRLTTPPISLSPALIEAIDVMIIMTHAKGVEKSARRVKNVHELQKVVGESASARTNQAFSWTATDDSFNRRGEPYLFDQISKDYGVSKQKLMDEMENRTKLLEWLQDKGVKDFGVVSSLVAEYYKNKEEILKMINSEDDEYTLEDVIEAESKVDLSRPDQLDNAMKENKKDKTNLESEIEDIDGNADVDIKKKAEQNPVAELEKKLKSEREKIEEVRSRTPEQRDQDPFENSESTGENPFEA